MQPASTAALALMAARAEPPVVIVEPRDGDVVASIFTVKVRHDDVWYGDTDDTGDVSADSVELWADNDTLLGQCSPCPDPDEATFEVELPPGEHTLIAVARYPYALETATSEVVTITVEAADKGDGCACATTGAPDFGLVWLGAAWLMRRRRRALDVVHPPARTRRPRHATTCSPCEVANEDASAPATDS